jgi:four helix bundle protein
MATINNFEDLEIWQLAREICMDIYRIINYKEFSRDFGLVKQINNSSGSIMDNIAEGFEREGNKEFGQFLTIAKGSCGESRSQLIRAHDRYYVSDEEYKIIYDKLINEGIKIKNFMNYLKRSGLRGNKYK